MVFGPPLSTSERVIHIKTLRRLFRRGEKTAFRSSQCLALKCKCDWCSKWADRDYQQWCLDTNTPEKALAAMLTASGLPTTQYSDAKSSAAEWKRWRDSHYDARIKVLLDAKEGVV